MPEFVVNSQRFDPYKNFKFRVKWDGKYVAGVSKVSGLKRSTEVVEYREGGDNNTSRELIGPTQFGPLVLERGLTHDTAFETWANLVWQYGAPGQPSLNDFRKDIVIELLNEAGQVVLAYNVYRCWVSEYEAFSELNANETSVVIERIKLQNEGWERDTSVVEPTQP